MDIKEQQMGDLIAAIMQVCKGQRLEIVLNSLGSCLASIALNSEEHFEDVQKCIDTTQKAMYKFRDAKWGKSNVD